MINPNRFKASYQGDEVWFILNDSYRSTIPQDAIVYTLAEAAILAQRPESTRKVAHEAKKAIRAKVVSQPKLPGLPPTNQFPTPRKRPTHPDHPPLITHPDYQGLLAG